MEDNTRNCPVCQQPVLPEDAATTCPQCGQVHHAACWESNGGCGAPACQPADTPQADAAVEAQAAEPAVADTVQASTDASAEPTITCPYCGASLQPGQNFCHKCGQTLQTAPADKASAVRETPAADAAPPAADAQPASAPAPKKKKGLLIGLIAAAVVVVGVVAALVLPGLLAKPEDYLVKGDYAKAYEIAKEEQRGDILIENRAACLSVEVSEGLKNPSSFELKNVWNDWDTGYLVIEAMGTNSYGGLVPGYYLYSLKSDEEETYLVTYVSSLDNEKIYSWDDYGDMLKKELDNAARDLIRIIRAEDSLALPKVNIDNINQLFENDLLDDVEWLIVPEEKADENAA